MPEFEESDGFDSRVMNACKALSFPDDLVTDPGIQKKLFDEFGGDLKVITGYDGGRPVGVLPLWRYRENGERRWTFIGNDEVAPYNDFLIQQKHIKSFVAAAPENTRLSNIHWRHPRGKGLETCVLVELPASFIDYFSELRPKVRQNLRRVYRKNRATGVFLNRVDDIDEFERLERNINFKSHEPFDVMTAMEEVRAYKLFIREAHKKGLLRMMSFEVGGKLAAINISFQSSIPGRGAKRHKIVYDQLCLRKPGMESKYLGIYAIAKNIEWAIQDGARYYDLGQGIYPYKMLWNVRPKKCRVWTNEMPRA